MKAGGWILLLTLPFSVAIPCGLLKKAAVCWMTVAGNDEALRAFDEDPSL
jgi:hypothetical protein